MSFVFILKILISAVFIALITEIAKKSTSLAGLLAAMPMATVISLFWIYFESKDYLKLADFSKSVFWGIFPTLLFYIPAIYMFKKGYNFYLVIFVSICFLLIGIYIHNLILKNF